MSSPGTEFDVVRTGSVWSSGVRRRSCSAGDCSAAYCSAAVLEWAIPLLGTKVGGGRSDDMGLGAVAAAKAVAPTYDGARGGRAPVWGDLVASLVAEGAVQAAEAGPGSPKAGPCSPKATSPKATSPKKGAPEPPPPETDSLESVNAGDILQCWGCRLEGRRKGKPHVQTRGEAGGEEDGGHTALVLENLGGGRFEVVEQLPIQAPGDAGGGPPVVQRNLLAFGELGRGRYCHSASLALECLWVTVDDGRE